MHPSSKKQRFSLVQSGGGLDGVIVPGLMFCVVLCNLTGLLVAGESNEPQKILHREKAVLILRMPASGTDYDFIEMEWVRSLAGDEHHRPPLKESIPLDFKNTLQISLPPGGVYKLTLKSHTPDQIRDFVLVRELQLVASSADQPGIPVAIPPAFPQKVIGFEGIPRDMSGKEGRSGIFFGIKIDVRNNTGQMRVANIPIDVAKTLRFDDLKPRPDMAWPISHLYLEDPGRVAFDCPLAHAECRMALNASDGRMTLTSHFLAPENESQRLGMLARMQNLIQYQVLESVKNPGVFDGNFTGLSASQLPGYKNLDSIEDYSAHLLRLGGTPLVRIEFGTSLKIIIGNNGTREMRVEQY